MGKFYVLGNFCSPSCACAYNIDVNDHKLWERNSLILKLYNELTDNNIDKIYPAPPKQILESFGGNINIEADMSLSRLLHFGIFRFAELDMRNELAITNPYILIWTIRQLFFVFKNLKSQERTIARLLCRRHHLSSIEWNAMVSCTSNSNSYRTRYVAKHRTRLRIERDKNIYRCPFLRVV